MLILYFIFIGIPELKENFGSSDKLINPNNYVDMFELNINDVDFAIVVNGNKKIEKIFFFSEKAVCLYNENIENCSLEEGLLKVVKMLISNDYLHNNDLLRVTCYENKLLSSFMSALLTVEDELKVAFEVQQSFSTLSNKTQSLSLEGDNYLFLLDYYSRDVIDQTERVVISQEDSYKYASSVYKKLEQYLATNSNYINISLIPALDGKTYPESESYYKFQDDKLYAYIKIDKYGYCFLGSSDNYKKGVCEE